MGVFNLNQLVTKTTRITATSKTLLDVLLITNSNVCVLMLFTIHLVIILVQTGTLLNFKKKSYNVKYGYHVTRFRSFKNFGMFNVDCFVKGTDLVFHTGRLCHVW